MNILLGFGMGFLALFLFGLYGIPRKLVKTSQLEYLLSMSLGLCLSTSIIGLLFTAKPVITFEKVALSYFTGALWCIGSLSFNKSIDCIGCSRATSIKNTTGVFATFIGIFLFREYSQTDLFLLFTVIAGSVLIFISSIVLGKLAPSEIEGSISFPQKIRGVGLALVAALAYSIYLIPGRYVQPGTAGWSWDYYLFIGQGAFLACLLSYSGMAPVKHLQHFMKIPFKQHLLAGTAGVLFGTALACTIASLNLVGMAVGMSLANMNIIVALPFSIFILKEIDLKMEQPRIAWGLMAAMAGTVLLAVSKL